MAGLEVSQAETVTNPLMTPSALPFEATHFDQLKDADFEPAIDAGVKQETKETDAIADNPAAPTFKNTIVAMERSGQLLGIATTILQHLVQANTDDTLNKLNETEAPKLQAHSDAILLNPKLFARIKTLYDKRDTLHLDKNQAFLLTRYYKKFVRAGAALSDADKARLRQLNGEIAKLEAQYPDKLTAAANALAVSVNDKAKLDGLTDAALGSAEAAAKTAKSSGKYLLALRNTTQQPILADLKDRGLRAQILSASESRGDGPGPDDLRGLISTLAQLRAERAKILGFPDFASYTLDDQMAKTPAQAKKLLTDLVPAATGKARAEAAELQKLIDAEKGGFKLTAADWEYYAAKLRKQKYAIDEQQVRQYFVLDRVLQDGVFFAAHQLYGLTFKPRTDIPVWQPDVRVYEVFDADAKSLALFYTDYFARPNKNGGAWCTYINQPSGLMSRKPIIVNVANFSKPATGEPALISFDDVITMFHEFGHALHAMFSVQYYPTEDGFSWPTDVIEFPSQFNEHWALDPAVFAHYAKNAKTGAAMPAALFDKIKETRTYGQGYATTEILAAALLDLEWHGLPANAPKQDPDTFEAAALKKDAVDMAEVPPRYRSTYFMHIWGNGYAANYYSYFWGEILDDDAFEWFTEHGGLTRANGDRFRKVLLGPGFTDDPMVSYRAFRGADPSVEALKRQRGLVAATSPS